MRKLDLQGIAVTAAGHCLCGEMLHPSQPAPPLHAAAGGSCRTPLSVCTTFGEAQHRKPFRRVLLPLHCAYGARPGAGSSARLSRAAERHKRDLTRSCRRQNETEPMFGDGQSRPAQQCRLSLAEPAPSADAHLSSLHIRMRTIRQSLALKQALRAALPRADCVSSRAVGAAAARAVVDPDTQSSQQQRLPSSGPGLDHFLRLHSAQQAQQTDRSAAARASQASDGHFTHAECAVQQGAQSSCNSRQATCRPCYWSYRVS